MTFVSDNEFELALNKMLRNLAAIKQTQNVFLNTHRNLPPKEKAAVIKKIVMDHKSVETFIEKSKQTETFNSGIKFKFENLKTQFASLRSHWKKIEAVL